MKNPLQFRLKLSAVLATTLALSSTLLSACAVYVPPPPRVAVVPRYEYVEPLPPAVVWGPRPYHRHYYRY